MNRWLLAWLLAAVSLAAGCTPGSAALRRSGPATAAPIAEPSPPPRPVVHAPPVWRSAAEAKQNCAEHLAAAGRLRAQLVAAAATPSVASVLEPMNDLLLEVDQVLGLGELMAAVHPDKAVQASAEACHQDAQKFLSQLELDRQVYDALVAVKLAGLAPATQRFVARLLRDYRRAGVDREPAVRAQLGELHAAMVKVGQDFNRAIREDKRSITLTRADLAGLPADYVDRHPPGADGLIRVTTDYPDLVPLLSYARDERVRRALWFEFVNLAYPKNEPVLRELLQLRHRYATTLGYPDWASYNAGDKMLDTKAKVAEFIDRVAAIARPRMARELPELLARKKVDDRQATEVKSWDRFYYVGKLQQERFGVDPQQVRAYFDYPRVKEGVLAVHQELYGLVFRRVPDAPVWHPSVEAYDVLERGQPVARFYLDMHPRDGKYNHAASFSLLSGVPQRQDPSGALVCNFPDPASGGPALMEHRDVVTLFHEFGHLMHHLLSGRHHWVTFSAYNVEWDFVEVPSQLAEEWAWHPDVLQRFAVHHETSQPIPRELCEKMRRADEFGKGVNVMRQMWLAALSLRTYDRDPAGIDLLALDRQLHEQYSPYRFEEGSHFFASFGHLEGYSSAYYTYMWSLTLVKDLFTQFAKAGIGDAATAAAYRRAVLEAGAARDAADIVVDFLGRPATFDAFQRWLETE